MEKKIFTNDEAYFFYVKIFTWLTNHSVGERRVISSYKHYSKELFQPLICRYNFLLKKERLSEVEKVFLESVFYIGKTLRVHPYNSRSRKFVYPTDYFSHWSKNIEGILNVKKHGDGLLLIGETTRDNPGIDIFGLLTFIFENYKMKNLSSLQNPKQLLNYEFENEIAAVLSKETLKDLRIINMEDALYFETEGISIPKDKWFRKTLP